MKAVRLTRPGKYQQNPEIVVIIDKSKKSQNIVFLSKTAKRPNCAKELVFLIIFLIKKKKLSVHTVFY